jgi:hypothetical protein
MEGSSSNLILCTIQEFCSRNLGKSLPTSVETVPAEIQTLYVPSAMSKNSNQFARYETRIRHVSTDCILNSMAN